MTQAWGGGYFHKSPSAHIKPTCNNTLKKKICRRHHGYRKKFLNPLKILFEVVSSASYTAQD